VGVDSGGQGKGFVSSGGGRRRGDGDGGRGRDNPRGGEYLAASDVKETSQKIGPGQLGPVWKRGRRTEKSLEVRVQGRKRSGRPVRDEKREGGGNGLPEEMKAK